MRFNPFDGQVDSVDQHDSRSSQIVQKPAERHTVPDKMIKTIQYDNHAVQEQIIS